jgi:hypothetical protein
LLHEHSVDEIVPELSPAEREQAIKLVGRSPRLYQPGTLDALNHRRALASPKPPQRPSDSARSDVAAEKQGGTQARQSNAKRATEEPLTEQRTIRPLPPSSRLE